MPEHEHFGGEDPERVADLVLDPANALPTRTRPRGRPPKPVERHERELRITPPDGLPITNWDIAPRNEVSKLVACEEGGIGTGKQLHYHVIVETTYSDEMLKSWIRRILNNYGGALGNAVYRTGKPHENTYGYVAKEENLKGLFGYTDEQYNNWVLASRQYRQTIAAERRQDQRLRSQKRAKQLRTVEDVVQQQLERGDIAATPAAIIRSVLDACVQHNVDWPTRIQMEAIVNRRRWAYSPETKDAVVNYYAQTFSRLEYTNNVNW